MVCIDLNANTVLRFHIHAKRGCHAAKGFREGYGSSTV
jgi:hypothetical protein